MGIKTVPHPPYCPDLVPCDFCLFPKPRGCHYETIEAMKEAVTKVVDTFTQEGFHGAFQMLERYQKCIVVGEDYFEGDLSFMSVLSKKVPPPKKSGKLFNDPSTINKHSWPVLVNRIGTLYLCDWNNFYCESLSSHTDVCLHWESFLRWDFLIWELILLRTFFLILVFFSLRFGQISPLAVFRWLTATSDRNAESCNRIPRDYWLL